MKSWLVVLIGLLVSWHFTDLHSSNKLYGILAPALFLIFVVALIRLLLGRRTGSQSDGGGDSGGFWGDGSSFWGGDNGDSGGGDGGGGD